MIMLKNLTGGERQTKTFEELAFSQCLIGAGLQRKLFSAVSILLSITAILGNSLILVALHKESSIHPPSKLLYRCLAATDLLVGLVSQPLYAIYRTSLVYQQLSLCRIAYDASYISSYALCMVSLLTMTAISIDRLLALLLGLRYKQIVTLKRSYIIVATFWVLSSVAAACNILDGRITIWYGRLVGPSCMIVSIVSYAKVFSVMRRHHAQLQDHVQQPPSQPNPLNMARYRKAVHSALWVQLALVVCYTPIHLVEIVIAYSKTYPSYLAVLRRIATALIFFNSTLNPFLYCWKISEVRHAVKQTIRRALFCPQS